MTLLTQLACSGNSVGLLALTACAKPQVYCLKAIRSIEAGEKIDLKYEKYEPTDPEMRSLLARDPVSQKQPYKAAVEDTLIITMKGISAAMQNTG